MNLRRAIAVLNGALLCMQFAPALAQKPEARTIGEELCRQHIPNDEIDDHAKTLSEELRQGAPKFIEEYNQYMKDLRSRPDAKAAEAEFAIDMYCRDPGDVTVNYSNGIVHNYSIDAWRVFEKNSVTHLKAGDNSAQQVQEYINKNVVADDRELFMRLFSKDLNELQLPYSAQNDANGAILIMAKPKP
ncbi:MAG TPA: hypothetical protein V6D22_21385 [Candidatus Obscuribacterales bacterium]